MSKKIIYILPNFDLRTDTHFSYLYELLQAASTELDVALLIEQSHSDTGYFEHIDTIYTLNATNPVARILKTLWYILLLRFKGYKKVYVHYSYYGALLSSIVMRLSGGRVWYWNCGMPWLFGKQYMLQVVLKCVNYMVAGAPSLFEMYHQYLGLNPKKGRVLPTWVNIEKFKQLQHTPLPREYSVPENKKIVLFVHRISKRKGAHMIVPVAKQFADDPNVHFVVAGSGPYFDTLQKEIATQHLSNITLLGKVPNQYIPALFAHASVYFMPSNEEGYARTHLESIVAGVPAVVTNVGATRDALARHQGGVLCEPEDVDCLTQGIKNMLQQPLQPRNVELIDQAVAVKTFIELFHE